MNDVRISPAAVTIYGASDDLIEVEGTVFGCDEYSAASAMFLVSSTDASVLVTVHFGQNGCWMVGLAPADEDIPMLPAKIDGDRYTARATFQNVVAVTRMAAVDG